MGVLIAGVLTSCKEETKPKVIYKEKEVATQTVERDSTQIKVSDLPVHMEGTKYVIFPVGDIRIYDNGNKSYGSSKTNTISYAISNYNRFEITGYFENLKFQHVDSTNIRPLTEKLIQIQTATYLSEFAQANKREILVYTLVDADTNLDSKLDSNDIKSLYISTIGGLQFTKLTKDYQELIDWNVVVPLNRLYFRAIEDINKNGAFDKNDKVHYYYANMNAKNWEVTEYDPVNNLHKIAEEQTAVVPAE